MRPGAKWRPDRDGPGRQMMPRSRCTDKDGEIAPFHMIRQMRRCRSSRDWTDPLGAQQWAIMRRYQKVFSCGTMRGNGLWRPFDSIGMSP
jgi:hypothetical protein